MSVPPPPGISPEQMNLLRIVCSMAWSDGELSSEEKDLMLSNLSRFFAEDEQQEQSLHQELQTYVSQNIPLDELIPQLETEGDRELALKLGYMVIQASRRTPSEAAINREEKVAYRRLVDLLALPEETINRIEWAADEELNQHEHDVIRAVTAGLGRFVGR